MIIRRVYYLIYWLDVDVFDCNLKPLCWLSQEMFILLYNYLFDQNGNTL